MAAVEVTDVQPYPPSGTPNPATQDDPYVPPARLRTPPDADTVAALQEQFIRIKQRTDTAWRDLENAISEGKAATKLFEQNYQSWASLLLRYHDALQKAGVGSSEDSPLPSMKGTAQ